VDSTNETFSKWCFLAVLSQNVSKTEDTWFVGSPIMNDYYTVFDMSPLVKGADFIQIGIAKRRDEE
jgi:hypothetical protein